VFFAPSRTGPRPVARDGTIHLVNPLWDPNGGADRRTVDLQRLLGAVRPARIWSEYRVDPAFGHLEVGRIRPWRYPNDGTVVLVGVYFRNGAWIHRTAAKRIVVIYNTEQPDRLQKTLRRIGDRPVQLVYTSEGLREATRRDLRHFLRDCPWLDDGVVLESFVEPSSFDAVFERRTRQAHRRHDGRFTVGRLSRDNPRKHHPCDPPFFSALAGRGMHVRVMGGESLRDNGINDPHVELLPAGAVSSSDFLSTLDAFYYRTHPTYFEAFGRVVLEAMLCGIPVVAEARGGYANFIRHGENGFLFDDPSDAMTQLAALQEDPAMRDRIGRSAHATAQRLFRDDLPERTLRALLAEPLPVAGLVRASGAAVAA
jgi:glycosyltransferase involved in cell wall biosynthesis